MLPSAQIAELLTEEVTNMENSCTSGSKVLLYSCSGAANTGYLADQIARKLFADGVGKMTCLAAVGTGNSGFIEAARTADLVVVIDGCPVSCGKQIMDKLGIRQLHVATTDIGIEKGKTAITADVIDNVTEKVRTLICEKLKPVE